MQLIRRFFFRITLLASVLGNVFPLLAQRPYYHPDERDWEGQELPTSSPMVHQVWLIGDVGRPTKVPMEPSLRLLQQQLQAADPERGTVVFLGDNIYPAGLPEKEHPDRAAAEQYITTQLDAVKGFDGNIFFIPGNHDWNRFRAGGRQAVLRQEEFIEDYLDRKGVMQPGNACGDPTAVELGDDITLIMLDSQWFLHDWRTEPGINTDCKVDSRYEFEAKLREVIDDHDKGRILLVQHHPLHSNGEHGGYFGIKDHLFPLTHLDKHLFVPLPLLGSIMPMARYLGVSAQEIPNAKNKAFVDILLDATFKRGNIIFASGHDHNLQYFQDEDVLSDRHFIVSGSGCKENYIRRSPNVNFAYPGSGFARLSYYKDGSVWLEMIRPTGTGEQGDVIFRRQVKAKDVSLKPAPITEVSWDSVQTQAGTIYEANNSKEKFFGKLYRDAWSAKLRFPTLNLDTVHGGLIPVKKGGGFQTLSLRLENPYEKQYVLRSVGKDVTKAIEGFFPILPDNSVLRDIVQDQIAMSHPYGATIIPPLADAAGVYHTNPQYVWLPAQPGLGDFNEEFGGKLFLFEERPAKNREDVASFGRPEDIESTRKVVRDLDKSSKNEADQQAVLRARLFDMWLGDWDRHDDQWRWSEFDKEGGGKLYQPVPRDRDQVFSVVDGLVPWLLTRKWGLRYLHDFDHDTRDIQGLNYNARHFDRYFLTQKDLSEWLAVADSLQRNLTDEVIEQAFQRWPDTIYALNGAEIIAKLKSRRARLPEFARRYYKYLAREVNVLGSEDDERFDITRMENGKTLVVGRRLSKKGKLKETFFRRTFDHTFTKEIRIYGFEGDDVFHITGTSPSGSLVRIIGGGDQDEIIDESRVGGGKRTVVYDTEVGTRLQLGQEARDKTRNSTGVNAYDRDAFKMNHYLPLIIPGYNIDDGVNIGGGMIATTHGFRKEPYKTRQKIVGTYAFATRALSMNYEGDFIGAIGRTDLWLNARAHAPSFVINYFGLGNETSYTEANDEDFNFNRVRMSGIELFPALKRTFNNQRQRLLIGPRYTFNQVEATQGRFIVQDSTLSPDIFDGRHYGGLQLSYQIQATDNSIFPQRGLNFNLTTGWLANLEQSTQNFAHLSTDFSVYHTIYWPTLITFATRVGYAQNWGTYDFFQAQRLGRRTNLRGFRGERFAGDAAFFHNTDIRIPVLRLKNYYLPLDVGLIGFVDYGRVWLSEENSDKWHVGYGGGLAISPYSAVVLTATYSKSEEFDIFELRFGFLF